MMITVFNHEEILNMKRPEPKYINPESEHFLKMTLTEFYLSNDTLPVNNPSRGRRPTNYGTMDSFLESKEQKAALELQAQHFSHSNHGVKNNASSISRTGRALKAFAEDDYVEEINTSVDSLASVSAPPRRL